MSTLYLLAVLVCCVSAETSEAGEERLGYEAGEGRLGYISINSDGTSSLTFNATSIQYAVILGVFVLVLSALILPLFGISLASVFGSSREDEYGHSGYGQQGYTRPAAAYQTYSKRSLEMLGPVLEALNAGRKYEG